MKSIHLVIIILIFGRYVSAQSENEIDPVRDIYGLQVQLLEVVSNDKCDCCTTGEVSDDTCTLYLGQVDQVFFIRDTSTHSLDLLKETKYFIVNTKDVKDRDVLGKILYATAENTCSRRIVKINRLIKTPPNLKPIHDKFAIITGLKQCVRRTFWNRLAIFFGSKKAKEKYRVIPASESVFVKSIEE